MSPQRSYCRKEHQTKEREELVMSKARYNFLKQYRIHCACSQDDSRPDLEFVYFNNGYAYASDGHILARVPLEMMLFALNNDEELPLLNGKAIHRRVFQKILQYDVITICDGFIKAEEEGHKITFSLRPQSELSRPKFEDILNPEVERVPVKDIGLSAKYLHTLAQAMGIESAVHMKFTSANRAIFIESNDSIGGVLGVIMPVAVQQTIEGF